MTSNDPARIAPPTRKSATAPSYVDEDPNLALVEQGLEAAENEIREAVADSYESAALDSPSEAENLDDIDFVEAESSQDTPELSAMRTETLPADAPEARRLPARNVQRQETVMTETSIPDSPDLKQQRIAVLAADGFEQSELLNPVDALENAGAVVDIITPDGEPIRGWDAKDWGQTISADLSLAEASPEDYDALLLPGGVINADSLRTDEKARDFAEHFFELDKPVFAICHGAQLLIDAGLVEGRKMTSYHAIATDLENAGAEWIDAEVVTDGVFITSRKPDDLPAFCKAICETLESAAVS